MIAARARRGRRGRVTTLGRTMPLRILAIALAASLALSAAGCGKRRAAVTPKGDEVRAVWGEPSGRFAGRPGKAVLMIIHGGGWQGNNPAQFQVSLATAKGYQNLGYTTVAVEYRAGAQSVEDVDDIYTQVRKRVGPDVPVCATGGSAGGHLALMLAVRHPDLDCVIALGAPTDLTALKRQRGGKQGDALSVSAFGRAHLVEFSPARHAKGIRAKLLLIYAADDPVVPAEQGRLMKRAFPSATLEVLPPGPVAFVHSGVTTEAKQRVTAQQLAFLDAVALQSSAP